MRPGHGFGARETGLLYIRTESFLFFYELKFIPKSSYHGPRITNADLAIHVTFKRISVNYKFHRNILKSRMKHAIIVQPTKREVFQ